MMLLTELLHSTDEEYRVEHENNRVTIEAIASDSRQVVPGSMFVAVQGEKNDGSAYVMDAIQKGATAVVIQDTVSVTVPKSVIVIRSPRPRVLLVRMLKSLYQPQPVHIAAVTGTDGKTSTADFCRQLWQMEEKRAVSIGTLGIHGNTSLATDQAVNTTPDPVMLHKMLQHVAREGCKHVVMEASSHGLHQYRLDGVRISAAGFTNLTRDHLDYHGTLEAYFQAKLRLFSEVLIAGGTAVVNADDPKFRRIHDACLARGIAVISYGYRGRDYRVRKITPSLEGLAVLAEIHGKSVHFMLNMVGEFQAMNALCALGLFAHAGGNLEAGIRHLPHLQTVPGRLERVALHPAGAAVFVDYAHTPAALGNVLKTLRAHTKGQLKIVFGCGGDRDKGKRPEMGKMAAEFADEVIITDDNPRHEPPERIREEVRQGAPKAKVVADRGQAIAFAIKSLQKQDVLLIAGKGHEKTQTIGNNVLPFDDADVARQVVQVITTSM